MQKSTKFSETGNKCYAVLLIIISGVAILGAFILLGFFFSWYGGEGCSFHTTIIAITLLFVIFNIGGGIFCGGRREGHFFSASIVSLYITFLLFAAVQADPSSGCNIWAGDKNNASLWIGVIISLFALCYTGMKANLLGVLAPQEPLLYRSGSPEEPLIDTDQKQTGTKKKGSTHSDDVVEGDVEEANSVADDNDNNDNDNNNDKNNDIDLSNDDQKKHMLKENLCFHVIMMLASCYMCMLFTNWGTTHGSITTTGSFSLWINMISQYVTEFLFVWVMVAPMLCPSRFQD